MKLVFSIMTVFTVLPYELTKLSDIHAGGDWTRFATVFCARVPLLASPMMNGLRCGIKICWIWS